ncbi:TPA: hypothetical protein ACPVYA_004281 [Vibrio parahaemolyticus]|uniref:hypothetical protein n=1 Tax=Vibrio parahaemolyticus TaxID=670 RepID=UPI0002A5978A|nr:hypothetical protein [Vibrio parahaemolyticus]AGB11028.1 hypothetical protein VPBB_2573 [Vibrio parahaemolyticus BB22OP]MBE4138082.1 hypothetical protein [Vibrio parahaemolyticus]MQF42716.1 hypothetical protein [Vibrio parahaemolyticus]TOZ80034.1 hypothetical protein DXJ97_22730 [Vibrio parahaemolyticus]TOZ99754.1 hypothetical protein DXJ96_22750 [Vibrio parahaemolyticus]
MSFLTGLVGKTLLEILKGLLMQVAWKVVLERFATRTVIWGLEKLRDLSSNDVVQETVDDVIYSLRGKRLKEIEQRE